MKIAKADAQVFPNAACVRLDLCRSPAIKSAFFAFFSLCLVGGCATVNMVDVGGEAEVNSLLPSQTRLSDAAGAVCSGCKARELVKPADGWDRLGRWLSGASLTETASKGPTYADHVQARSEDPAEQKLQVAGDATWLAGALGKARLASAALRQRPVDIRRADVQALEAALVCAETGQQLASDALASLEASARTGVLTSLEAELVAARAELDKLVQARSDASGMS